MSALSCALALLSGAIGAGFASGREIVRFFARHGAAAGASVALSLLVLCTLFLRLPAQMERFGCRTLPALCRLRFGRRLGQLCALLFVLLFAVTGGAMLCACAELCALTLPVLFAYPFGMILTLLAGAAFSACGLCGLALPGALLAVLLPVMLVLLFLLPRGEACFLPAMAPDVPVQAALDGTAYGALNAALLAGVLPLLAPLSPRLRRRAVFVFSALFGVLLALGTLVCRRHFAAVLHQPLPFVWLSRRLGVGGYGLLAVCLYAAALSTLCAMLSSLRAAGVRASLAAALCLLCALPGFDALIAHAYPALGALCAGLLLLLCLGPAPCARIHAEQTHSP